MNNYTAVVTVVGSDKPGIIAEVTGILAKENVNICDISQTVVQDVFNMIMLIDTTDAEISYENLSEEFEKAEKELSCQIILQKREVFSAMHRI